MVVEITIITSLECSQNNSGITQAVVAALLTINYRCVNPATVAQWRVFNESLRCRRRRLTELIGSCLVKTARSISKHRLDWPSATLMSNAVWFYDAHRITMSLFTS